MIHPKSGDIGYVAGLARVQEVLAIRPKSGDIGYGNPQSLTDRSPLTDRGRLANGHR